MILRRHDLLRPDSTAWDAMLRRHPGFADLPLVAEWAQLDWPVIVRRRMVGDFVNSVPAALPLPPYLGKRRLAFSFSSSDVVTALPPVLLCDAARTAPREWRPVVEAMLDLGDSVEIAPRVFGALLWQHATGLPYLSARSDLDLIWSISDERTALSLVDRLLRLDGAGLNWRELAQSRADLSDELLVKTMDGVEMRTRSALFRTLVSPL
jgi:phosphoribosyl-dephospho-CoA transferase